MSESLSEPAHTPVSDDPNDSFVPACPVCGGATQPANDIRPATMFACNECATSVSVPPGAWAVARTKRLVKWLAKAP